LSPANVDLVPPDFDEADVRLEQARRHQAGARLDGIDNESSYILLYSAVHKAASAALLAAGRRITAGDDAHVLLLRETRRLLGREHTGLIDRLDRARKQRHRVAYETQEIGQAQLASLHAAADELLDVVGALVEERRAAP
jgi:hypothetical protein